MSEQDSTIATYLIETPFDLRAAVATFAGEQSTGTFVAVPGETQALRDRFATRLVELRELPSATQPSLPSRKDAPRPDTIYRRAEIDVTIPLEATGTELTALLAAVAGNVFEVGELTGIRLIDLRLPEALLAAHPGPAFGITGTRRLTGVTTGPVIGTIIKPSIGLSPEQTAQRVDELAAGGIDFIKDDELLSNPTYSTVTARAGAIMPVLERHRDRGGAPVMYAFNITADDVEQMLRHHDTVREAGGSCVMVSVNQVGITAVRSLRQRAELPIHGHRNGWAQLTRAPGLGIEFAVAQQLWRLAGVDHLHVNGLANKFWEPDGSVLRSIQACLTPLRSDADRALPVVSSGQWGGQAPATYREAGTADLMYLAGGGIQGHPGGIAAGVRAVRAAWQAAMEGRTLAHAARDVPELAAALRQFAPGDTG